MVVWWLERGGGEDGGGETGGGKSGWAAGLINLLSFSCLRLWY